MKTYLNISIENIDTFCAVLGNELVIEEGIISTIIIPCFNIGFYENEINPESVTKAIDKCYLLFKLATRLDIELSLYDNAFPSKNGLIELTGNRIKYSLNLNVEKGTKNSDYFLEGLCFRNNSFSYANYKIQANSLRVIIPDSSKVVEIYTIDKRYKNDNEIKDFLLNRSCPIKDLLSLLQI